MGKSAACPLLFSFFFVFSSLFSSSSAWDGIDHRSSVRDGEILISAGGSFELGFFSPGNSAKKYLCIRFTKGKERPIVWVANRGRPLNDSSGLLKFGGDGNLVASDEAGSVVWSTGLVSNASGSRVARLLESGNLVVQDEPGRDDAVPGGYLWQSFDEPGDTMISGMKVLVSTKTGMRRYMTSWNSPDDPSPGKYSLGVEVDKLPRLVLREGSAVKHSSGLWNGIRFTGYDLPRNSAYFNYSLVSSGDEIYYIDNVFRNSRYVRFWLTPSGTVQRLVWDDNTSSWINAWSGPTFCQQFATCGPYGICPENVFPRCQCLRGFRPKSPQAWSMGNGTAGCVRETRLDCGGGDVFLRVEQVRLPELDNSSTVSMNMSLEECRHRCAKDCSCTAYAAADALRGTGCITWSGDLVNMWHFSNSDQEFYLRVAASEQDLTLGSFGKKRSEQQAIVASVGSLLAMVVLAFCVLRMKKKLSKPKSTGRRKHHPYGIVDEEDAELPLFDFGTIASATNNFSIDNKIGEGGFGIVYKGDLGSGQPIAVKRLSWTSKQGLVEFMNEAKLIAKLQHKNLVRLLGCCIHEEERMLIFEYMQNKSLDLFLFDESKRGLLHWRMRLDIILEIARGLLYLHHDSRFTIIHRDLKAGNILLDGSMNPKISDFGTARIFKPNQLIDNTKRVIGT